MSVSEPDRPYAGRYAELYDLFYADKPYADEAGFVHECIREFATNPAHDILELACGTGRHALELERFGYNVTATDRSADMIGIAWQRAAENNSKVEFAIANMQELELGNRKWDAAVCLFDSIGYLKTSDAIANALARIRNHLREGGILILEFWNAPARLNNYSRRRERRWKIENGEVVRISETTLDRENRLAKVNYEVRELKSDGTSEQFTELHVNRFFRVDEMQRLLEHGNFNALKFFAGFSRTKPITDETWHIVALAQKQ